ncbi:hypothetical protein HPB49_009036 [Dermacentor silvarum]|uniref:Uncharacterized protein n=1 Tax=Dermacentor silvarum TaxID=543639 RepID=A0ACB8DYB2_DERSI|nr:hypothetical protein HPB49_009036 [Dermacentor silvarum]
MPSKPQEFAVCAREHCGCPFFGTEAARAAHPPPAPEWSIRRRHQRGHARAQPASRALTPTTACPPSLLIQAGCKRYVPSTCAYRARYSQTPQLQRRLGLARIELPHPRLKGLAHRLLQAKRGFLSAQVTATDGHLVGLSLNMKHGHKPGLHLNFGPEHSKKDWDGPGYSKKGWDGPGYSKKGWDGPGYSKKGWDDALDSSPLHSSSFSAGPYSSYDSQNFQRLFRGADGLSLGHASSLYSEGQPYHYKDAAAFGALYPFAGYQVPSYLTTVPKLPVTKLVDSMPSVLPAVSGLYDQAMIVTAPVQTPSIVQGFPAAKAVGGHTKVPAARVVHKVPLSVLPKKATYLQQQVPGTAHGYYPVLVQKVPVSKFAAHVPQSHYVMHTVKPVSSIGVLRTPIYAATGTGELYPIDVDGSAFQEDDEGGAEGLQNGHSGGQSGPGYGNGDAAGPQTGGSQEGQFNGGRGSKYGHGNSGTAASPNAGVFQAAGGYNTGVFRADQFTGGGSGSYGHGNGAAGGFGNGGTQRGQFSGGGGGKHGGGNGFRQGLGNNGEGSQEDNGNNNGAGGGGGDENGGGSQGFPPGLGYPRGGNGGGQVHKSYGSAGAGPQPGFANGGYQEGNGFSGGAGTGYANGGTGANAGFQGPQQHAFPQAVTGFKDVQLLAAVPVGPKHGYKGALPAEFVYEEVPGRGLQAQVQHFPDIPGPEESIARGQFNRNTQGYTNGNGRINKGDSSEDSSERLTGAAQANGGYKGPQAGSSAASSPRVSSGSENDQEGNNGGGWKPIIDTRYNAKFNGGSVSAGQFGSRLQEAPQGGNVLRKTYGGVRANGPSSFNNGAAGGLVNGDLQVRGSHVQYPKYRYRNERLFGNNNFQGNGGERKFSEGSGESDFSAQFNGNGNGVRNPNFGNDGNGAFPANTRAQQFNAEGNVRINNFRNGGNFRSQNHGYRESNENGGTLTQGKFSNVGVGRQPDFEQSEGNQRNSGSEARFSEASQRGPFQGNVNGRNFGQTLPNGRFRGRTNGGGPTPPKFCPKGGWRPIIKNGKKAGVNNAQRPMQQFSEGQGNGFHDQNGFEAPRQAQNGDDTTSGRYNTESNGFQGNGQLYQGQGPRGNGGGSASYFSGAVGQFDDVGTSDVQGEIGNGGANGAFGNRQVNGFASQGSLGPQSGPSNGGHRGVGYSSGQGTEFGGAQSFETPRQFLNGRARGVSFSQGSAYYEGEELPGEESFKREEIKKVFFRPAGIETKKVPKSVVISGRAAYRKGSNKSATPKRTLLNIDASIGASQTITPKEQPSLEQLLATYKRDDQKPFMLDLRSLRGHGYLDVPFSESVNAPIQKVSPVDVGRPELGKTVSEGLLTKEIKIESSTGPKKVVAPEYLETSTSTDESSEEREKDNAPPRTLESISSTESGLSAKELSVSYPGVGASVTSVERSPMEPESSSSEEVSESKEKDPVPDSPGGSLDKSALHDNRGWFEMNYGQRRRPISYKQDRISSSYLIPVRVPSSLKSKIRMSG